MNTVFNHSALEYDDWFVRNEMAYRSELAVVKAILPPGGRSLRAVLQPGGIKKVSIGTQRNKAVRMAKTAAQGRNS